MTENSITISIIIPAYNRGKLLPVCIDSIIHQTFTRWECIIVDDFSTDNTREVVEKMSAADKRIRYISNTRKKGAQGARNSGIIEAKGEWVAFNDSDDEWLPHKLAQQYEVLKEKAFNPFLVVHGNCIINDPQTNSVSKWNLLVVDGEKPYKILLQFPSPMFQGMITSKKALMAINYLDENVPSYQEWDTAIMLSAICDFVHITESLFIYHKHTGETISKDMERDITGVDYIRMKYRDDFIKYYDETTFIHFLLMNIYRIIKYKYWWLGIRLLQKNYEFIPSMRYKYWVMCFRVHADPLKPGKRLSSIKKLVARFKRKFRV